MKVWKVWVVRDEFYEQFYGVVTTEALADAMVSESLKRSPGAETFAEEYEVVTTAAGVTEAVKAALTWEPHVAD
jgi:hypothetical protein